MQTKLFSAQPGGSPCLTESEQVANAEILRALDLVECYHSFASAAKDSRLFKRMFPTDPVAKKYQMGETKSQIYYSIWDITLHKEHYFKRCTKQTIFF